MDRDEILRRLRERIVGFAASRCERETAEDLAQEVLMVLHEKYPQVERLEELLPLSMQIVRFKMMGQRRKAYRRGEHAQVSVEDVPIPDSSDSPEQSYERRQMLDKLEAAIGGMGDRCRELFRLKLEGRTFPEIQALMNVRSINTVYTWDLRCRQQLLERMGGSWEPK